MRATQLQANSASIIVQRIIDLRRDGILVHVADERAHSCAVARGSLVCQVWDDPVPRQQVEFECADAIPCVECPLTFEDALAQKRIRERGEIVEVGDVPVIGVEVVDPLFADIDVQRRVRIVAPIVGARIDAVEQPLLRIPDA